MKMSHIWRIDSTMIIEVYHYYPYKTNERYSINSVRKQVSSVSGLINEFSALSWSLRPNFCREILNLKSITIHQNNPKKTELTSHPQRSPSNCSWTLHPKQSPARQNPLKGSPLGGWEDARAHTVHILAAKQAEKKNKNKTTWRGS